ncbi:MAG: hypothetical protein RLZZ436_2695 [Planctomycetota bacterium]|jgi:hypothetical protein
MSSPLNQLPDSSCGSTPGSVPVFNCIVILKHDGQSGRVVGRVANLEGIEGAASGERELLFLLTRRFRDTLRELTRSSQPIPWKNPTETPAAGEQQRFIPIHL